MLVWKKRNINSAVVLCTIIMVHSGTGSGFDLWFSCLSFIHDLTVHIKTKLYNM